MIRNAEEAREIVERQRSGMELMRDADQIILARGYLACHEQREAEIADLKKGFDAVYLRNMCCTGHQEIRHNDDGPCPVCRERDKAKALQQTVNFFASVIKSGEPWTDKCEAAYRGNS